MKKTGLQGYRKNIIKFLCALMVVFPWITYLNLSQLSEAERRVFSGYQGMLIDFFIYYKGVMLILAAVILVLFFVGERLLPRKVDNNVPLFKGKNRWLFVLSGIFVGGTLVSTLFSQYQENALEGSPTVGEGLWVLLAYMVMIFAFYNYFANEYAFDMAKKAISVLSGITVALTLVEWFYKPLLEIGLVQALVAPPQYAGLVASMKADAFKSAISLTFYNPGYFGGFVCILLPFVLSFFLQSKKLKERVLYGVLTAGLIFAVTTSNTTTALYIAILEVVLVLVVYLISSGRSVLLQSVGLAVIAVVAMLCSGVVTGNSFLNVFSNANSATGNVVEGRFEIEDIQLEGNRIILVGEKDSLEITFDETGLSFCDENGKMLSSDFNGESFEFQEEEFADLSVSIMSPNETMQGVSNCILVDAGYKDTIDFFLLSDGTVSGAGLGGAVLTDIGDAGTPEKLKSFYGMFTGRGYAWVNSLPVLKETLLIGKGPGNFAYYFKQFDYVGLLHTHGSTKQIIDKPHNAYLQYAINLGLPAAIAFFGIFVGVLIKAVRLFWKNKKNVMENPIYMGAMVAVLGFLIYSIINDSIVAVTPVACMIAGILLASAYMMEEKK